MGLFVQEQDRDEICRTCGLFIQKTTCDTMYQLKDTELEIICAPWIDKDAWLFESYFITLDEIIEEVTDERTLNILIFNLDILRRL